MVSKDQAIGGIIFLACLLVGIFYALTLFVPNWAASIIGTHSEGGIRFWLIAIPVFIAFIAIMGIGAWIGWTMATTPPPKPIEEITSEMEKEEKPAVEEKPAEEEAVKEEPKKPEKRK
jgi:hypothetical protein